MTVFATVCLLVLLWQVLKLRNLTANTTADLPRRFSVAAVLLCFACVCTQWPAFPVTMQARSGLHYFAAVMMLTPFVGILGARRPGMKAWPWFVVVPLIAILQWPSLSQVMSEKATTAISIPTPTLLGFLLVLLMGVGNYFGTINTAAGVICGIAVFLFVLPVSEWALFSNSWCVPTSCALLAFAASLLPGRYGALEAEAAIEIENADPNQLWIDFRDIYGIVWAKRVMDRFNQFAVREQWDVMLSLDGFVNRSGNAVETSVVTNSERPLEILCWILRRFVDTPFLRRYLPESALPEESKQ